MENIVATVSQNMFGWLVISAVVNGQRIERKFGEMNWSQAKQAFEDELLEEGILEEVVYY